MKYINLLIGLILITALISGCAKETITEPAQVEEAEDTAKEAETLEELDSTYVEVEDLDVGELY